MMDRRLVIAAMLALILAGFSGCGSNPEANAPSQPSEAQATEPPAHEDVSAGEEPQVIAEEDAGTMLRMTIGGTDVAVEWEENESVEALKALCAEGPLEIQMTMYGGFEQVGSIGQSLPRDDAQVTTDAGDIVLYSGDQIVVFYGSNSWAYTRLGRVADKTPDEMADLLGNGDVTLVICYG